MNVAKLVQDKGNSQQDGKQQEDFDNDHGFWMYVEVIFCASSQAKSAGYYKERDGEYPKGVTPECFYRGVQFRIRLESRLKHAGMTVFGKKST